MLSFIRIVIASLLVSFVYGISTPTTTTPHILARTNAEAFKRHERVLAPRTFKPTLDAHGRTRSLPIQKMNRAKRAQVSARTCPNFQNVDAFIVVTAQNGQNLGFVTAASDGTFGVTNNVAQALLVRAGASVNGLPQIIYSVNAGPLNAVGATQSGVSTTDIAPGTPGFAKLVQSSAGGVGFNTADTTSGPGTGQASIFTYSCVLGFTTLTANWINASGGRGVATSFFYSFNGLLGITGDYLAFSRTYSAFVNYEVVFSLVAASSAGVSSS